MDKTFSRSLLFGFLSALLCSLLVGCSKPETPKGDNGGTYYEGAIKNQKTKKDGQ